jgi:hypothetical protein
MKKLILSVVPMVIALFATAQTATNFNCNDCSATNHDLFTELNSGKVIVITWVMPCGACIAPASTAANTVQGYASSNPGTVKFYVADDYANTSCSTLNSWLSTNSITADAVFSNSAVSMADYGSPGMPKTIVIGPDHTVFYNQNNSVSANALQTAINNALAVGISENKNTISTVSLFPNPVNGNSTVLNYSLAQNADVTIDIYNVLGESVKSNIVQNQTAGKHEATIDLAGVTNGVYFIRLGAGEAAQTIKFVLTN